MSLCAECGAQLRDLELCPHHHCVYGDDWAAGNRILCDLLHRHIVPARLPPGQRENEAITAWAVP